MAKKLSASAIAQIIADADTDNDSCPSDEEPLYMDKSEDEQPTDSNESDSDYLEESDDDGDTSDCAYLSRDGTEWGISSPHRASYRMHNICRITSGPTNNVKHLNDSTGIFKCLIDETIIRSIVKCTNIRIENESLSDREVHENLVEDVTVDEVYSYIGILVLLGLLKKRSVDISDIWREAENALHRIDMVCATMSRERFKFLSRFFTFDDMTTRNSRAVEDPKFYKFREVFDYVRNKCRNAYEPGCHTSVDENLYSFRGKFKARQYMPKKPAKYGIKIWQLVDSSSRYLYNFDIYLGKDGNIVTKNLGEEVVLSLSSTLNKTGRNITVDNYFTSKSLALKLWDNGLTLVGTIKSHRREVPSAARPLKDRIVHSSIFLFSRFLTLVSYVPKKNRVVNILSTQHHRKAISEQAKEKKPEALLYYNETMGGSDTFDQMISEYSCRRTTGRWTMRLFHYLIDAMMINAFIIAREVFSADNMRQRYGIPKFQRRKFLEQIAASLMESQISNRALKYTSHAGVSRRLQHSFRVSGCPLQQQDRISSDVNRRGRCHHCPRKLDKKTALKCYLSDKFICQSHTEKRNCCSPSCSF